MEIWQKWVFPFFIIFTNLPTLLQAGPSHVNNRPLGISSVHPTSTDALSQFSSSQTPVLPLDQPDSHNQVRSDFTFGFISFWALLPVRIAYIRNWSKRRRRDRTSIAREPIHPSSDYSGHRTEGSSFSPTPNRKSRTFWVTNTHNTNWSWRFSGSSDRMSPIYPVTYWILIRITAGRSWI